MLPDLEAMVQTQQVIPQDKRWNLYLRVGEERDDNVFARCNSVTHVVPGVGHSRAGTECVI